MAFSDSHAEGTPKAYGSPRSLADIIADGVFLAAEQDIAFGEAMGHITHVEYNFRSARGTVNAEGAEDTMAATESADTPAGPEQDMPVDVRITSSTGTHDILGHRIAVITDNEWTWATVATLGLNVPELQTPQPYSPALIRAARTLVSGRPVVIAQQGASASDLAAVSLDFHGTGVPSHRAIVQGLSEIPLDTDEERALAAYAVTGPNADAAVESVTLNTGYISRIGTNGLSLEQVTADAHYRAAEQQLFVTGRYPGLKAHVDLASGRTQVVSGAGSYTANAHVIATVTDDVWTWAWADPGLKDAGAQRAAFNLRRFGADNGIGAFLRPQMPADVARELRLAQAAMPVLQVWTLQAVTLSASTLGLVLLDAPELALPPLSDAARAATLRVSLPAGIDGNRARAAYEALPRG